jgi:hypothetical protein
VVRVGQVRRSTLLDPGGLSIPALAATRRSVSPSRPPPHPVVRFVSRRPGRPSSARSAR